MKKTLSLLLAVLLVLSMNVALADKTLDKDNLTGETLVTLTINRADDVFTVIIPSTVAIDPATKKGEGTITLKSGWQLISCNRLFVRLKSAQNGIKSRSPQYANFTLKDSSTGMTAPYSVGIEKQGVDFGSADTQYETAYSTWNIINVSKTSANTSDITALLTFKVPTLPEPGTYTDTLTFEIVIE